MLLSLDDIKRIKELGFSRDFFVDEVDGWLQLKNKDGLCVFHDRSSCTIYESRPSGCRLYPVIYDADNDCAIIDEECPYGTYFSLTTCIEKELFSLVDQIKNERQKSKEK
jgi:Fe-S-cluster containining protein